MELQERWMRFEQTGNVEDYLAYRKDYSRLKDKTPVEEALKNKAGGEDGDRADRDDGHGAFGIAHQGVR